MTSSPPRIAIIGGMGPLASAAFVNTIYERSLDGLEQDAPAIVLWSDPSFPDRSRCLLEGDTDRLAAHLRETVQRCERAGAETIVICCVTAHAVVPLLPPAMQARIVSLVEVLLSAVIQQARPLIVLSSLGTRGAGVLEAHPLWREASHWLRWLDRADQERMHHAIYRIKRNAGVSTTVALVDELIRKYHVDSFAAACTELHIVHKHWGPRPSPIDPLDIVATRIAAASAHASMAGGR